MDAQVEQLWTMANILGLVVVVAVAALLTLLVIFVARIRKRVAAIKATLIAAKANTADTALITTTAGGVEAVLNEGLEHHLFLGRVLDKVRS
jgi:nucleoside phosphorylase